jgi:transcription initiation factor TFIIIB Brf1 subunit/transcription initiation factor TFIIB
LNRCQYRKTIEKGIKKDLEMLGLPHNIVDIADRFYTQVTNGDIKRSLMRKGIMFACVYQAYMEIDQPQIPEKLAKIFNLDNKNISKGLTYFDSRLPQTQHIKVHNITAEHFIPDILEKFNFKREHINNVLGLYKNIQNKSATLNRSTPHSVACGLVYYYLKKSNVDITASNFGAIVKLSEITITKIEEILGKLNL